MTHAVITDDVPDVDIPCCYGSAIYGPERCTCWTVEYDQPIYEKQAGPANVRAAMCGDCAFRKDSPERSGDSRYEHSEEDGLEHLISSGTTFLCHQGMARKVARVHPDGRREAFDTDAYGPEGTHCMADGRPAEICAGFWAMKSKQGDAR